MEPQISNRKSVHWFPRMPGLPASAWRAEQGVNRPSSRSCHERVREGFLGEHQTANGPNKLVVSEVAIESIDAAFFGFLARQKLLHCVIEPR